ncbi:glycerophosphodiester phosphodiesterase family protein [Thermococcus sp.]|uniref:glycerophosphodiester phosphodiesterase family protein n=1 Tax=Thermococcus sp. TaxID=35749 RepID=UPI0026187751|nr:glycerophosphodiester phosphodiesterase family protein [Thermococcus sp.]
MKMTFKDSDKIFILGHRGFRGKLENTIPAFKRALKYADGIEFDVRITHDKKLVLLHDGTFKSDGQEYSVKALTYRELTRLHPKGKLVPLLKDALVLKPRLINADLKDIEALNPLLNKLESTGLLDRTVISVDSLGWLKIIRRECPYCRVGLSITTPRTFFRSFKFREGYLHVPLDLIKYTGFRVFRTLLRFYGKKTKIWLWNYQMNEIEWIPKLLPYAYAIISDDPARLKRFISLEPTTNEAIHHVGTRKSYSSGA